MVVGVDDDGTITYVHYHIRNGITNDYMNLRSPGVLNQMEKGRLRVINSPMRLAIPGRPHPPNWLSGSSIAVSGWDISCGTEPVRNPFAQEPADPLDGPRRFRHVRHGRVPDVPELFSDFQPDVDPGLLRLAGKTQ
jgi:hypothetical protein